MFSLRSLVLIVAAALLLANRQPDPRQLDPLRGVWRNPDGSVTIRVDQCGPRVCGWVIAADEESIKDARDGGTPHLIGTQLFQDYRRDGASHWSGVVFVPDLGHSFSSHIVLVDHDHARIAGCLIGRFLCQSQIWQRQ